MLIKFFDFSMLRLFEDEAYSGVLHLFKICHFQKMKNSSVLFLCFVGSIALSITCKCHIPGKFSIQQVELFCDVFNVSG